MSGLTTSSHPMPDDDAEAGAPSNVYAAAGLPEWVAFPDRPELGHHPDPNSPLRTRCGMPMAGSVPVKCPRWVHTACFPAADPAEQATLPKDGGLFDAEPS